MWINCEEERADFLHHAEMINAAVRPRRKHNSCSKCLSGCERFCPCMWAQLGRFHEDVTGGAAKHHLNLSNSPRERSKRSPHCHGCGVGGASRVRPGKGTRSRTVIYFSLADDYCTPSSHRLKTVPIEARSGSHLQGPIWDSPS